MTPQMGIPRSDEEYMKIISLDGFRRVGVQNSKLDRCRNLFLHHQVQNSYGTSWATMKCEVEIILWR
jgi:hypothetical protein